MLTRDEVLRGIYGAWRLALGDRRGLEWIDRSPIGAWRSFLLAPLLYPLDLINFGMIVQSVPVTAPLPQILAAQLVNYTIGWVAFPLLMLGLAPALNRDREVLGYISVLNWTSAIATIFSLALTFLLWSGLVPDSLGNFLFFVQLAFLFAYGWFVAKTALNLNALAAAGLSAAQIVIGFVVAQITLALIL